MPQPRLPLGLLRPLARPPRHLVRHGHVRQHDQEPESPRPPQGARSMRLTDFDALSFDCYGTLIDWEAGLAAVLGPWPRSRGLALSGEALLAAYSGHESRAEAGHPGEAYPAILARSLRGLGRELGAEVSDEDAGRLARSVPDWPAFPDSRAALADLAGRYRLLVL